MCHDKLIHWLPDSDTIELTDEFQLANNFTVHEISSHMSMRSLILKHFCHIMSSCIQAHAEHWNSPSTRLYFGRFLHSVSSPLNYAFHKQKTASLQRPVRQLLHITAETESSGCMLLSQNSRGLSPVIRLVWITAKYLLIIPIAVVDVDAYLGWLSVPLKCDWN